MLHKNTVCWLMLQPVGDGASTILLRADTFSFTSIVLIFSVALLLSECKLFSISYKLS